MPFVTRKTLVTAVLLAGIAGLAMGAFIWSGLYNVGADDPHLRPTYTMLRLMRERSIARQIRPLEVPPLGDPASIRRGAGNYDAMCTGCHLAPGRGSTELSRGLYPSPPDFSRREPIAPAQAFWVIKHGIKASGMPAWGRSMDDASIWSMVAFLQTLPTLDAAAYQALVAASGGHSHGGAATMLARPPGGMAHDGKPMAAGHTQASEPHAHPSGTPADHHGAAKVEPAPAMVEHRHLDGTIESHPAPQAIEADDDAEHQH